MILEIHLQSVHPGRLVLLINGIFRAARFANPDSMTSYSRGSSRIWTSASVKERSSQKDSQGVSMSYTRHARSMSSEGINLFVKTRIEEGIGRD